MVQLIHIDSLTPDESVRFTVKNDDLTESMDRIGQTRPIEVYNDKGFIKIRDGLSRYNSAVELGWQFLACEVLGYKV